MIEYKVFGSLRNSMGDSVLRVTQGISRETERLGSDFNIGDLVCFASIVVIPNALKNIYDIVHYQPSHVRFDGSARKYCTRCIYELFEDDFCKIGFGFRNLFHSIPRMKLYDDVDYDASPIPLQNSTMVRPMLSDCETKLLEHILLAKEKKSRLFVKIGNKKDLSEGIYYENGVFDSSKFHSLLNVLDFLPEDNRKKCSFAFSVSHAVAEYIENVDVIFYQDELSDWNVDAHQIVSIDWSGDEIVSKEEESAIGARKKYKEELFDKVTDFDSVADLLTAWGKSERIESVLEKIVTASSVEYLVNLKTLPRQIEEYNPYINNLINTRRSVVDRVRLLNSSCFSIRIEDVKIDGWDTLAEVYYILLTYYKQDWKKILSEIIKNNKPWCWEYSNSLEDLCEKIYVVFCDEAVSSIRQNYLKENLLRGKFKRFFIDGYTKEEWERLLKDKSVVNIAIEKLLSHKSVPIDIYDDKYETLLNNYIDCKIGNGFSINSEIATKILAKCSDSVANYIFEKLCNVNNLADCLRSFDQRMTDRMKLKSVEVCLVAINEEISIEKAADWILLLQNYNIDNLLAEKFNEYNLERITDFCEASLFSKIRNERIRGIFEEKNEKIRIEKLPNEEDIIEYHKKSPQKLSAVETEMDVRTILSGKRKDVVLGMIKVYDFNKAVGVNKFGISSTNIFKPLNLFWKNVYAEIIDFLKKYGSDKCSDYQWIQLSEINDVPTNVVERLFDAALGDTKDFDDKDLCGILDGFRKFVNDRIGGNSKLEANEALHIKRGDSFYKLSVKLKKIISQYNKSCDNKDNTFKPIIFSDFIIFDKRKLSQKEKIFAVSGSIAALLLIVFVSFVVIIKQTSYIHNAHTEIVGYGCDYGFDSLHSNPMVAVANWVTDSSYNDTVVKNIYVKYRCIDSVIAQKPLLPFLECFIKNVPPVMYEKDTVFIPSLSCYDLDSLYMFDSICRGDDRLAIEDNDTMFLVCKWNEKRKLSLDTIVIYKEKSLLSHFMVDTCVLFKADSIFILRGDTLLFVQERNRNVVGLKYLEMVRILDTLCEKRIDF